MGLSGANGVRVVKNELKFRVMLITLPLNSAHIFLLRISRVYLLVKSRGVTRISASTLDDTASFKCNPTRLTAWTAASKSAHLIWFCYLEMNFFRRRFGDCTGRLSWLLSWIIPDEAAPGYKDDGPTSSAAFVCLRFCCWFEKLILFSV